MKILDTIGGRRFLVMLSVLAACSWLVYHKAITPEIFGEVVKWVAMIFIGGNSFEAWVKNKS
jgi:hypothetical protein